ncbi:MAG: hypothetical protein CL484_01920 [Acidobacteria bacterium]|nr:hypothetical protein [Acidobacteriota bacterium]|tara:strand:- start:966 stop:1328 length:363 start_codon:yes stop_codon:yes gene_type:complete
MVTVAAVLSGWSLLAGLFGVGLVQPMPIMATIGCVEPDGRDGFNLARASEPQALLERMPAVPSADTPLGTKTLKLVGTLEEFRVSTHVGKKVWVKGLLNPGESLDLLNLTSITQLAVACD